ncbi:DNA polymerase LigD, polymerase domain-containing protein [Streptomyces sp. SPB78]|nr:DNA polymerase LigD, polymerase domain-containing protein [Streptomyces sp. SPB78]
MTPITHVAGRRLALSNLEKVLYPGDGFTKGEVLHYYAGVAEVMLPHLRDRPVSFLRYPDGPSGQRFFSKNPPPGTPEWVRVARVERSDGAGEQVVIDDLPSLMWAANLVTEFHTPQWRLDAQGRADRLVLDLDPGAPATIVECGVVARWLRDRLAADGLTAYVKTSGSKGLHLLAPLVPAPSSEVTAYAKRLAVEAEQELPDLALHRMTKKLRAGYFFHRLQPERRREDDGDPVHPPRPRLPQRLGAADVGGGRALRGPGGPGRTGPGRPVPPQEARRTARAPGDRRGRGGTAVRDAGAAGEAP